ncbi:onanonoxo-7-onima-8-eninoihtemlysoneda [Ophiostoma piceae UAMH 11346]|uniref:Onanonoxo-7-onima-8-eninoihtemlysoneda n=1 Tax=Ophiostoma piceae (strain UAMH 11346) TaxID=1262450 RepID=S3BT37_OPHP1|nr:onanonoxo-7-onima-8-eninoihtemlysoneda [Ophiostoma piceae UAMH 11346]
MRTTITTTTKTMPATAITSSVLRRSLRAYQVYGANTGVGKTVMSTILCGALHRAFPHERVWYLKPVSTGPQEDADDGHLARFSPRTSSKTLVQYGQPVSPHIAARTAAPLTDSAIREQIQRHVTECAEDGQGTLLLETAGGVHSPTPSGSSQADLYRPLRLPVLLVGDHRLGGISSSISAFESLHIRGYDLNTVLVFEDAQYENHLYLRDYFAERDIPLLSLPPPPPQSSTTESDRERMAEYYEEMSARPCVLDTVTALSTSHTLRLARLDTMAPQAHKHIWYPFTQHSPMTPASIMTIDSAHGDFFQTYCPSSSSEIKSSSPPPPENTLQSTLDGSASWWTQGLGHANPTLSLAAAHAAGRYGHVMFASAIHEPALSLAELLLKHLGNQRMQRVFYSDNGSTGVEVGVKMALTAASERYGYGDRMKEVGVLGLKGSYHGDTIGAMDCSEPSTYNKRVHWYQGRGHWFDYPQVKMKDGTWVVEPPEGQEEEFGPVARFTSLDEVFDVEARDSSAAAATYKKHILSILDRLVREEGKSFGALIMEPVMLGAGGMLLVDPLFQRTLISTIRASHSLFSPTPSPEDANTWIGLPVVFDEVFTGLNRLGPFSPSTLLGAQPDISVHAKLLTGGLVPLAATVASEAIYDAFLGSEKSDALLHGHSYTAHAVGCKVAETSVKELLKLQESGAWDGFQEPWNEARGVVDSRKDSKVAGRVWSMWSPTFLSTVSHRAEVESVVALGSVLAIKLRDENPGYESNSAIGLQSALSCVDGGFGIHSRVLGNVFYVMTGQTTEVDVVRRVEQKVLEAL